jgi:C4-dicarboxylate-specific signal transduction histidine kinase
MWGKLAKNRIKTTVVLAVFSTLYAVYGISYQAGLNSPQEKASQSLEQVANALSVPIEKYSCLPEFIASQSIIADTLLHKDSSAFISRANTYLENTNQIAKGRPSIFWTKRG